MTARGGPNPRQPGNRPLGQPSFSSVCVPVVEGTGSGGVSHGVSALGTGAGGSTQELTQLLAGLKEVLGRLAPLPGAGSPTAAWVPNHDTGVSGPVTVANGTLTGSAAGGLQTPLGAPAASGAGGVQVAVAGEVSVADSRQGNTGEKEVDRVRLADLDKCEVYVCFEGPLGAHLKQEVHEKIWRGEYVEIFFPPSAGKIEPGQR